MEHAEAPIMGAYCPLTQGRHSIPRCEYVLLGQGVHCLPCTGCVPEAHCTHVVPPTMLETSPEMQFLQPTWPSSAV